MCGEGHIPKVEEVRPGAIWTVRLGKGTITYNKPGKYFEARCSRHKKCKEHRTAILSGETDVRVVGP